MKCPRKEKHCKPTICFKTIKRNFICSGISNKPTKYKYDIVWLCLKGKFSETFIEMTKAEALGIISVLTGSLFGLEQLKKEIRRL